MLWWKSALGDFLTAACEWARCRGVMKLSHKRLITAPFCLITASLMRRSVLPRHSFYTLYTKGSCLHLVLRWLLVDWSTCRQGRQTALHTRCLNASLSSTFNHFSGWGRVCALVYVLYVWAFLIFNTAKWACAIFVQLIVLNLHVHSIYYI